MIKRCVHLASHRELSQQHILNGIVIVPGYGITFCLSHRNKAKGNYDTRIINIMYAIQTNQPLEIPIYSVFLTKVDFL